MSVVHPYRIKHIETGLYYTPGPTSNLSEKGKIYNTNNNLINYLGEHFTIDLRLFNRKTIEKYKDVLSKCGILNSSSWKKYNVYAAEFEREDLTLNDVTTAN